jgi:nucleoside-diphosphate-sugar epimerase
MFSRRFGVRSTILRFFSVYGPGQSSGVASGVVSILLRNARAGETLRVRARQFRDFVDVRDAVRAVELAILRPSPDFRVFNVGTGTATPIAELGDLIRQVVGSAPPMILDMTPGAESYVADPRRAAAELGFEAAISLPEGLDWYHRHLDPPTRASGDRSRGGR